MIHSSVKPTYQETVRLARKSSFHNCLSQHHIKIVVDFVILTLKWGAYSAPQPVS